LVQIAVDVSASMCPEGFVKNLTRFHFDKHRNGLNFEPNLSVRNW